MTDEYADVRVLDGIDGRVATGLMFLLFDEEM
jgi:hypothetical protein